MQVKSGVTWRLGKTFEPWQAGIVSQHFFFFFSVKGKTISVLPKNKVLQISDVSVPRSHSSNSILTHNGWWVPCYSQTSVREKACGNTQEAWEIWDLRCKYGAREKSSPPIEIPALLGPEDKF